MKLRWLALKAASGIMAAGMRVDTVPVLWVFSPLAMDIGWAIADLATRGIDEPSGPYAEEA
jgi:hypothetical protein